MTGEIHERRDSGLERFRTCGLQEWRVQDRRDAEHEKRRDSGLTGFMTAGGIPKRRDTGK